MNSITYGAMIKEYLDNNGIKYSFLANEIGIPINILCNMLNGKRKITVEEYFMICSVLKISIDYFKNA